MSTYGCFNKPRPKEIKMLTVQSGYTWSPSTGNRADNMVLVPFVMTRDCQYTIMHATDKLCAGCIHQHKEAV